ncbi:MAG: hypothetical protein RUMPE_00131 [Eubacteriales bacterium SKADARSKE-1]|nr:hypothetical protein [Eubacteriales bacterium SKADARSKE-1]
MSNKKTKHSKTSQHSLTVRILAGICGLLMIGSLFLTALHY